MRVLSFNLNLLENSHIGNYVMCVPNNCIFSFTTIYNDEIIYIYIYTQTLFLTINVCLYSFWSSFFHIKAIMADIHSHSTQAWGQLHSNVMHYHYITFEFACITLHYHYFIFSKVMHYITLLSKCNALHYTLH